MVDEIVNFFQPVVGKIYLDATLGDGGHSQVLLKHGASVIGLDQDQNALNRTQVRLGQPENLKLIKANFKDLSDLNLPPFDGIIFDLGVSTHQLLDPSRGFSFKEGPLDMRMDHSLSVTAADLINGLTEKELSDLFFNLGDEVRAKVYARRIAKARLKHPLNSTRELAELIAYNSPRGKTHPATKIFQALRMAVNLEREALTSALPQAVSLLKKDGTLAVISFHSGEDRLIKVFFKNQANLKIINQKPLTPSMEEVKQNPRARSAKLRLATKI